MLNNVSKMHCNEISAEMVLVHGQGPLWVSRCSLSKIYEYFKPIISGRHVAVYLFQHPYVSVSWRSAHSQGKEAISGDPRKCWVGLVSDHPYPLNLEDTPTAFIHLRVSPKTELSLAAVDTIQPYKRENHINQRQSANVMGQTISNCDPPFYQHRLSSSYYTSPDIMDEQGFVLSSGAHLLSKTNSSMKETLHNTVRKYCSCVIFYLFSASM